MGKNTVRLFCSLGIFIFSLCFTKVLSAPASIQNNNIIDVMQNDDQLCPMPRFVRENHIIEGCRNVTYPEPELATDPKFRDKFLCTAFYDTWYKYCKQDPSQVLFKDEAAFASYIQKLVPGEEDNDQTTFCNNIKSIKFSYEKLKLPLSRVNLNKTSVCYQTCFQITGNFVPLCGILAWSKSIDVEAEQPNTNVEPDKIKVSENKSVHQQAEESNVSAVKNSKEKVQGIADDTVNKNAKVNVNNVDTTAEDTEKSKAKPVNETDKKMKSSIEKPESETGIKTKNVDNNNSVPSNQQVPNNEKEKNVEKTSKGETRTEAQNNGDSTNSNVNTDIKVTGNDDIEANKKEIISPNTDDHDNSVIQDDWSQAEEDKLPNDPNDDQPNLPDPVVADQSQSVPEPSEQRDIVSRYHSIRTDEDSHFFTYFTIVSLVSIAAYIGYHNKQKILAIVLEGRRSRNSRGRRRPSTANYRKLDCTLEEAVTSQCDANVTHVIY